MPQPCPATSPDHTNETGRVSSAAVRNDPVRASPPALSDRVTKRFVYGEAGVKELWTVEPTGAVERWWGSGLSQSEFLTERLVSPLLPGFELDLSQLLVE